MARRGAPKGNSNALKHGKYTRERRALYAAIRAHIEEGRRLIAWAELVSAKLAFGESLHGVAAPEIRSLAEGADLLRLPAGCGGGGADPCAGGKLQARVGLHGRPDPARAPACDAVPSGRLGRAARRDRENSERRRGAGPRERVRGYIRPRGELPQFDRRLSLRADRRHRPVASAPRRAGCGPEARWARRRDARRVQAAHHARLRQAAGEAARDRGARLDGARFRAGAQPPRQDRAYPSGAVGVGWVSIPTSPLWGGRKMRSIFRVGERCGAGAPTRNLFAALRDFDLPTRGRWKV